jgi:carbonic anhydrase/acetyltransferase-like protein (isoleucine patch superfamily)
VLAQFALIVVAILGVMALVIDLGSVTLSRVLMQNAADSAVLEGLRERDRGMNPEVHADAFRDDCVRRNAARNVVSWTFDDNFDLGSDDLQLGAGGEIPFTDTGISDPALNASQHFDLANPGVYKPALERNQPTNAEHGDIVSGNFNPLAPVGIENDDYSRTSADFVRAAAVPPPVGVPLGTPCPADDDFSAMPPPDGSVIAADAFEVRLRRTSDRDALANVAGESSGGPALPLFFARGTPIQVPGDPTEYSARRDGITVRATAIAHLRPAMRIGASNLALPERGAVAYAVERACWSNLAVESDPDNPGSALLPNATVDADAKTVSVNDTTNCPAGSVRFITAGRSVGEIVPLPGASPIAACAIDGSCLIGFVAIFQTIGAVDRVVGFGRAALVDPASPTGPVTIPVTGTASSTLVPKRDSPKRIADRNASATLVEGLPADLTAAQIDQIRLARAALSTSLLLAPVLVR